MSRGIARVNLLNSNGEVFRVGQPDAGNWDFLYVASSTKDVVYNVGDKVQLPDGRVFYYAKCGASLTDQKCAVSQYSPLVLTKTAAVGAADAGARELTLTVSAGAIGVARDGVIAEDELRGGYIHIYNSSTVRNNRGIVGNTALAADGTSFTVYLDAGISSDVSASTYAEIIRSPFMDVRQEAGHDVRFLGMPMAKATTGQYFWVQTAGPVRISPDRGATFTTQFLLNAECFFGYNGGVVFQQEIIDLPSGEKTYGYQRAGFVIENPRLGSDTPAPFVWLQVIP